MEKEILATEYVKQNGVDYDTLFSVLHSDALYDAVEEDGGKPYTGIVYETYLDGSLAYYCHFKNGFEDGKYVEFHKNGNLKSVEMMEHGQTKGGQKEWFENGNLKSISEFSNGKCLSYTKWDEEGHMIAEKKG
jgi:antitoxin component YwqK of YwqJK toxin-antitoxin module